MSSKNLCVSRKKNGRFVKKTMIKGIALKHLNKSGSEIESVVNKGNKNVLVGPPGKRIVDLLELGNNLICRFCQEVLSLRNIVSEKRVGLHSVLTISCHKCNKINAADTGKIENDISHTNAAVVLGAVHSGVGNTALNKILACCDIPGISNDMYKKYEAIVGSVMEEEAQKSCKRAADEERRLVIKNISKLCQEL